ncbi:MAG TPA: complex I subunit 5 family protein [Mycobacteriales bacterium]|nr:complex I subunit 5 family protein [Mycobacteriales bacterium]
MNATDLLLLPVAVPLLAAAIVAGVGRLLPRILLDAVVLVVALGVASLGALLLVATRRHDVATVAGGWGAVHGHPVGIDVVADPMTAGLICLDGLVLAIALAYTWHYFDDVDAVLHGLLLAFVGGLAGFALAGDLFTLFVMLELVSVIGFVLTGYRIEAERSLQGALAFAVASTIGGVLTLTGIALVYARTGQLALASIGRSLAEQPADGLVAASFALVLAGFLVKAATVPFHFWTAGAEMVAPTPVCILFSALLVTSGVYAVGRIYHVAYQQALPGADVRPVLLAFGAASALVGALMSLGQRHFKRMLAFSTIAHSGILLVGVGLLNRDGAAGAVTYAVGHAGAKGALFCVGGVLLSRFKSVDENDLHGRGRRLAATGVAAALGALALAGAPPFGTGLGKALTEDAADSAGEQWLVPVLVLASGLTGAAVLRFTIRCFLGWGRPVDSGGVPGRRGEEPEPDPAGRLLVSAWLLLGLSLLAGLAGTGWAAHVGSSYVDSGAYTRALWGGPAPPAVAMHLTGWHATGLPLAFAPALLACAIAALWLLPGIGTATRAVTLSVLRPLRAMHTGRLGDETTWLLAGTGAFGIAMLLLRA